MAAFGTRGRPLTAEEDSPPSISAFPPSTRRNPLSPRTQAPESPIPMM